jgi:hypothetical protein
MKIKRKRAELNGVGPRYTIRQSEPTNWHTHVIEPTVRRPPAALHPDRWTPPASARRVGSGSRLHSSALHPPCDVARAATRRAPEAGAEKGV